MVSMALWLALAARAEDVGPEPPAAPPERHLALSVGSGPQPVQTLTLGLTGLAGRVLVPAGGGAVVVSLGHTSFRGSSFPEDGFSDRDFSRAGTTTGFVGYRGGAPPDEPAVVPYGIGGALVQRGVISSGNPGDVYRNQVWSVGALAGLGVDGFVTPSLAIGVELGGMGGVAMGGNRYRGESDGRFSATGLSTFASAQVVVWR